MFCCFSQNFKKRKNVADKIVEFLAVIQDCTFIVTIIDHFNRSTVAVSINKTTKMTVIENVVDP